MGAVSHVYGTQNHTTYANPDILKCIVFRYGNTDSNDEVVGTWQDVCLIEAAAELYSVDYLGTFKIKIMDEPQASVRVKLHC